jgi:hypothetical protein
MTAQVSGYDARQVQPGHLRAPRLVWSRYLIRHRTTARQPT